MSTVPEPGDRANAQVYDDAFAMAALKRANERLARSHGVGDAADFLARELDQAYMERHLSDDDVGGGARNG